MGDACAVGLHYTEESLGTESFVKSCSRPASTLPQSHYLHCIRWWTNLPFALEGAAISLPGPFIKQTSWKDILEQRALSTSACKMPRNGRDQGRAASHHSPAENSVFELS